MLFITLKLGYTTKVKMANIQLSSLVTDIKGSIGGTTFSRNRSGLTAKGKLVGKKNTTQRQQIELQNNLRAINAWSNLSLTNKQLWNEYAGVNTKTNRYGRIKSLTGFNWYVSVYNAWFYMYGTEVIVPPAYAYPAFLPSFSISVNPIGIQVTWSTPVDSSLIDLFIFTSSPTRATSTLTRGLYRLTQKGGVNYSSSFNITSGWEKAHGMQWADVASSGAFFINTQIIAISKSGGITGTGVTSLGEFTTVGIGSMAIGTSFIVG
jgi:hypothetical protein